MLKRTVLKFAAASALSTVVSFSAVAGGMEKPQNNMFTGFFGTVGFQWVGMEYKDMFIAVRNLGNGGPSGEINNVPNSGGTFYNGAFKANLEFAHVFGDVSGGFYLGAALDFSSGVPINNTLRPDVQTFLVTLANAPVELFAKLNSNFVFSGLLKLGYAWNTWLLYAQGGFAASSTSWWTNSFGNEQVWNGWTPGESVGAGLEFFLAKDLVVGAEYLYSSFADVSNHFITTTITAPSFGYQGWITTKWTTNRYGIYLKYKFFS